MINKGDDFDAMGFLFAVFALGIGGAVFGMGLSLMLYDRQINISLPGSAMLCGLIGSGVGLFIRNGVMFIAALGVATQSILFGIFLNAQSNSASFLWDACRALGGELLFLCGYLLFINVPKLFWTPREGAKATTEFFHFLKRHWVWTLIIVFLITTSLFHY